MSTPSCVNTRHRLGEVLATDFPWCEPHTEAIAGLFKAYVARKRANGQVDFDDLLLLWWAALRDERLGPRMIEMFDHVLVDEYQDVNALQVEIVRALRPDGRGLTVVGDDAQAIYGFRGADAGYLHELDELARRGHGRGSGTQFPLRAADLEPREPRATARRPVSVSSCGETGPEAADQCSSAAMTRRAKPAPSSTGSSMPTRKGMRLRDQAILVRAAHHSDLIELELHRSPGPIPQVRGPPLCRGGPREGLCCRRSPCSTIRQTSWRGSACCACTKASARPAAECCSASSRRKRGRANTSGPRRWRPRRLGRGSSLSETLEGLGAARRQIGALARVTAVFRLLRPLVLSRYSEGPARVEDLDRLSAAAGAMDDLSSVAR